MFCDNIEILIKQYIDYLIVKSHDHHDQFLKRLKADREAAMSEAAVFSFLRYYDFDVRIGEIVGRGGVDFICESDDNKLAVEVTHIAREKVEEKSGWRDFIPEDVYVSSYTPITDQIQTKAKSKVVQLSGIEMPRILVITTFHSAGDILLGTHAAETLYTGDTIIRMPVGDTIEEGAEVAPLTNSTFIRIRDGNVESARMSISCIMLMSCNNKGYSILGALHPEPAETMHIEHFPYIPFARMVYPIEDGRIQIEWIQHRVVTIQQPYPQITLQDNELRA